MPGEAAMELVCRDDVIYVDSRRYIHRPSQLASYPCAILGTVRNDWQSPDLPSWLVVHNSQDLQLLIQENSKLEDK
jgi:hypothetical protein